MIRRVISQNLLSRCRAKNGVSNCETSGPKAPLFHFNLQRNSSRAMPKIEVSRQECLHDGTSSHRDGQSALACDYLMHLYRPLAGLRLMEQAPAAGILALVENVD